MVGGAVGVFVAGVAVGVVVGLVAVFVVRAGVRELRRRRVAAVGHGPVGGWVR
jgi:uncharacterized protein (DUF2062 family)